MPVCVCVRTWHGCWCHCERALGCVGPSERVSATVAFCQPVRVDTVLARFPVCVCVALGVGVCVYLVVATAAQSWTVLEFPPDLSLGAGVQCG